MKWRNLLISLGLFTITLIYISLIQSCGFLISTEPDFSVLPSPVEVDETTKYYTETQIQFTGDPAKDFGTSRLLFSDPTNDGPEPQAEIVDIYIAYSKRYLYIGHKSPDLGTGPDYLNRGAFYIFIDNGITNGPYSSGPTILNSSGLSSAGISGNFDFLDDCNVEITNTLPNKFSVYIKHFRPYQYSEPTGENIKYYNFLESAVHMEEIKGSTVTVSWSRYITNNVTEIAVPWAFILGKDTTKAPTYIYIVFRIDDALTGKFSGKDWAPENDGKVITNWIQLKVGK